MLRQCTALLLLLAFLASSFSKAVIVADFYANQDYIAKNLCENKGNTKLHCCGRCMLRKRLAREADQDKDNPERKAENKQEILCLRDMGPFAAAPYRVCVIHPYQCIPVASAVDRSLDIFHPPA
jgi:hypothetical protein